MANNAMPPMKDLAKALITIAVFAAICAMAIGILIKGAGDSLASFCQTLDSLDTAIIVALITGSISILTVVAGGIASNVQRKKYYLRQHRERPYQKLIEMVYKMQAKGKNPAGYSEKEILDDFNEFSQALTLWGSPKAIKLWNSWRLAGVEGKPNPQDLLLAMEQIMLQLRCDMGQKRGLKKGDLLKLFINDVDEKLLK